MGDREILVELQRQRPRRPQPTSVAVVIKAGESVSNAFELTDARDIVGFCFDRIDPCPISFMWAPTADGEFRDAHDGNGELVLDVASPNRAVFARAGLPDGWVRVKLGTSAAPVRQAEDRVITVLLA
jgi:hypothetical protein